MRLPISHPCTGRYAVFQPPGESGFPNFEDHVVIRRHIGEPFTVSFCVHVPFDEPPLQLWDDVGSSQHLTVYHGFFLAYSLDGGESFLKPSEQQRAAVGYAADGRWSVIKIHESRIVKDTLLVKVYKDDLVSPDLDPELLRQIYREGKRTLRITTWRVPLDQNEKPVDVGHEVVEQTFSERKSRGGSELLKTDGTRLLARCKPDEKFRPVPLLSLLRELDPSQVDFFGGAGGRSFL